MVYLKTQFTRQQIPTSSSGLGAHIRGAFRRAVAIAVCFLGGIAFAQVPGPVTLTGSGGTETNFISVGTGGDSIYTFGSYTVHVFTSGGNFTPPDGVSQVDVLVVGGGGGGGGDRRGGGGGGAGGLIWQLNYGVSSSTTYPVVVGSGGAGGAPGNGASGGDSSFNTAIAVSGGGGGGRGDTTANGLAGGSGGGGGGPGNTSGGNGIAGQGFNGAGGTNGQNNDDRGGGGGGKGGAGTVGSDNDPGSGGVGGIGLNMSASLGTGVGQNGWFAGGGGGGKRTGNGGAGGNGGGGAGSGATDVPVAGTAATGGGGGGRGGDNNNQAGASGGSGVVIVRYLTPTAKTYRVHSFTSGGSFQAPSGVSSVDLVVVAGGGGGGATYGGGGGAGGLRLQNGVAVTLTPVPVTIGAGGSGGAGVTNVDDIAGSGTKGANSSFGTIIAEGGGFGMGGAQNTVGTAGGNGGSGGGGGGITAGAQKPGGTATPAGQGNNGGAGNSNTTTDNRTGGGGGGAGTAGATGQNTVGGNGGIGLNLGSRFGTGVGASGWFAGGGGGGKRSGTGDGGTGGEGGGGNGGGQTNANPIAGIANTGGGGGGGINGVAGAAGGSGAVVLRYLPATMRISQQHAAFASVLGGAVLPTAIIIEVLSSTGTPVVGASITASISFGGGTLGGTVTRTTNANGLATFNDLTITGASGDRRIRFTAAGSTDTVETNNISIVTYHFDITHAANYALCTASSAVTITVRDSSNAVVTGFSGTLTLSNSQGLGNYTLNAGTPANFSNGTANDGVATYTFSPANNGVVVLDFSATVTGTYSFNGLSGSIATEGYAGGLIVEDCEFRISHDLASAACTEERINIGVYGAVSNAVISSYVGNVTLGTETVNSGNWSKTTTPADALGSFNNGASNDGAASYSFVSGDAGTITLNFQDTTPRTINFNVTATGVNSPSSPNDPLLVNSACSFRISHDTAGNVCTVEQITLGVYANNALVTNYAGAVNLSTAGAAGGNWTKTSTPANALGTLDNGASNDGAASYTFVAGDAGEIILNFQDNTAETVNFNVTAAGVSTPVNPYDADLVISACSFRIAHSDTTDVCSIELVTITLVTSTGASVTDYTGTINLSTTNGYGTWSKTGTLADAEGTLTDPVAGDGSASYAFVAGDLGTITLDFRHTNASGITNINVSDGTTLDPRNSASAYDHNITVAPCTFEISHSGSETACEVEAVTFTVRNSLGGLAVDYVGTMVLATNTNHGNWLVSNADGVLGDTASDDDGVATYKFVDSDNAVAVLSFSNPHAEVVNFDANDDGIAVDAGFDPNLVISSCLPTVVGNASCVVGSSGTISLPAQNTIENQRGRMVLMTIAGASAGVPAVSAATFNSVPMTLIRKEVNSSGEGSVVEMWGILENDLPDNAGTYTGARTGGVAGSAMCLMVIDQVAQSFPVAVSPATTGPVNGSQNSGTNTISTTITTQANNSLVVAATNMDGTSGNNLRSYALPQPGDMYVRRWGQNPPAVIANPTGNNSRFAGATGRLPTAGITTINEQLSAVGTSATQIMVSFRPLIAGSPLAANYEPVLLFQTFAGNMSYRAIGNTLRSTYNESGPAPLGCNFVPVGTGSAATLDLPAGSTVTAAYLYWFGSGDDALGQTDADVTFGATGSEVPITAQNTFLIDNVGNDNDVDYFTGYRDVTNLITGNGSYTLKDLTVQNGAPWNVTQSCAGGWAMVVVYENPAERLRVLNLFHGFQPFQSSSFTLVPRNFRMAAHGQPGEDTLPNGQVTHITVEGDETLNATDETEGLAIQSQPDSATFTPIVSSLNPLGQEFNSTITKPVYAFDPGTGYYEFVPNGGENGDGIDIDFPGPQVNSGGPRFGNSWGLDVDTHYLQGANPGEPLYEFSYLGSEAERITTRYSAEADLVLLISEVISVTNFPLADIEVTKSEVGSFKVNSQGAYQISVTNNGNGGIGGGFANGEIIVADILPAGMTFASAGDVSGDDWSCSVTLSPGAFTCVYDIPSDWNDGAVAGQLAGGESLPPINVTVQIGGPPTFFNNTASPYTNNAKNSVRVLHSGGNCAAAPDGVIPDPDSCDRSPQFDNYNDLEGGNIDINDVDDKQPNNNNVDSVTTVVRGVEVDLTMDKFVADILEEDEQGIYTLRVTNNGPDATTAPFTVTDTNPVGVDFVSATGFVPGDWSCTVGPNLSCTHAGPLGVGASSDILLTVDVTGADGYNVTNTATVTAGSYNFDLVPANNTDTDITEIAGAPVASQEKFLMSVSSFNEFAAAHGLTTIGGLTDFEDDDYIIYDPVTDTATMFYDNSALGFDVRDADAVHLMKNGHIVISAAEAGSTVGTNNLAFEPGDLVIYDPIIGTARMLFDGSAIFGGANPGDVNITAVYLEGDCKPVPPNATQDCSIIFAATPAAGGSTIDGVPFTSADLIRYDLDTGAASLYFDGSTYFDDPDNTTINGFYLRVDPTDPNDTVEKLIISASNSAGDSITIGGIVGWDPVTGTIFTQDDVTELNRVDDETENLFLGNVELGVFESSGDEDKLSIDALHVIEDGYVGHFRISQVGGEGSVCSVAGLQLRISKHEGLTHDRDTDYYGSIRLTTNTGIGNWALVGGNGVLNNGTADDGEAIYTYVPSDGGTVILSLNQSVAGIVDIDVTNGYAREGSPAGVGAEAPPFVYSSGVTLDYRDNFDTISFSNQDGANGWATDWVESDVTAGPSAGDVKVQGGKAVFTRTAGTTEPSLTRTIDLSGATLQSDLLLSFSYSYAGLGTFDEFIVEARHTSAGNPAWVQLALFKPGTTLSAGGVGSAVSGNLNLSAAFGVNAPTATTQIRFRVKQGYNLSGQTFSIDDVKLTAATNNCNISPLGVNHYEININGVTNGTYMGAVACVGLDVTVTAHDSSHSPVLPGAIPIQLTTNTNRGNWSRVLVGTGALANGAANDGAATYTFPSNENSVTFRFDYTGPLTDPEIVNVDVTDNVNTEIAGEDPNASVSQVGLRVLNSGTMDAVSPIPLQIAGKASDVAPNASVLYVQAVSSVGSDPGICQPLFDVGQTLQFEFAAECEDNDECVAGETFEVNGTGVALVDNIVGSNPPASHTQVNIAMVDIGGGVPGAPIVIDYSDVGKMRLHTRFDIPFGDNVDPLLATKSGDTLDTVSNQFIVRPFGFDVDFSDGRQTNGSADASYAADHTGSLWKIAGESFDTTVSAVGWEAGDDLNNDGVPDTNASLANNHVTPNFDQDSSAGGYSVLLSVTDNKVPGGIPGELTDGLLGFNNFDNFTSGVSTHSSNYNEVGIIDMQAKIVNFVSNPDLADKLDNNIDPEIPYLGTTNVRGHVYNVGRFYPNRFNVLSTALNSRADQACTPDSSFTYMNEDFEVEMVLTATGLTQGGTYITQNYLGDYARLDTFAELGMVAIDDVAGDDDVDYTFRLSNSTIPGNYAGSWAGGQLALNGNMRFLRASPASPDGPYPDMQIAFRPADEDGVTIDPARDGSDTGVLNVDVDVLPVEPGTYVYSLIDEHEFRYGRLIVNNAYGPETEDLALTFLVEYFDGNSFVRNTLDNCTTFSIDDLSFEAGTYTGNLDSGETDLNDPDTVTFNEGQTQGLQPTPDPTDYPLSTSAPGEGNGGTVRIRLDLTEAELEYLGFEWDDTDDDYNEDPTGLIEFGQYRMHDRVINWQEIYNRATPTP